MVKILDKYKDLTAVIPVYNEEELLLEYLPSSIDKLKKGYPGIKILLVENGSTDDSLRLCENLAEEHSLSLISLSSASYGNAFREGLCGVKTEYAIWFNADWVDIDFPKQCMQAFEVEHPDVIIGCKGHSLSDDDRPVHRKILSKVLTKSINSLTGYSGGDTHGIKFFKLASTAPIIKDTKQNELVESEFLIMAQNKNLSLKELPVKVKEIRSPRVVISKRVKEDAKELIKLKLSLRNNKKQDS